MIKLIAKNQDKLASALNKVNGKAKEHTFTSVQLLDLAVSAENKLDNLGLLKKHRPGAKIYVLSSEKMPNAYTYTRTGNSATLVRRTTGWFIDDLRRIENIYPSEGGNMRIRLTKTQDLALIENLRKQYSIPKENS